MRDRLVKTRLAGAAVWSRRERPSFPVLAKVDDPTLELSPGTTVLHDASYMRSFPRPPVQAGRFVC